MTTDKRTDVWCRDFIIWKINSELWAVFWAGLWNKRVWADYEQLLRPVFSLFRGQKKSKFFFENTLMAAMKSRIIPFLLKKLKENFWPRYMKVGTNHLFSYLWLWQTLIQYFLTLMLFNVEAFRFSSWNLADKF